MKKSIFLLILLFGIAGAVYFFTREDGDDKAASSGSASSGSASGEEEVYTDDTSLTGDLANLQTRANGGDIKAQYDLAQHYAKGDGVDVNEKRAKYWYKKAAAKDHGDALFRLGNYCLINSFESPDLSPLAHLSAEVYYVVGFNVDDYYSRDQEKIKRKFLSNFVKSKEGKLEYTDNFVEACRYYAKALINGHAEASYVFGALMLQHDLREKMEGVLYELFKNFEQKQKNKYSKKYEYKTAFFIPAAKAGDPAAQYFLGVCLSLGDEYSGKIPNEKIREQFEKMKYNQTANRQLANDYFVKSTGLGFAPAQHYLGKAYYSGKYFVKSYRESFKYFSMAAEQGNPDAQYQLGCFYRDGVTGIKKDPQKAVSFFEKAASQKHADAQFALAICYTHGIGVEKDLAKAAEWFKEAADSGGHIEAEYRYALCARDAIGIEENPTDAREYFGRAARGNHLDAQYLYGYCLANGYGGDKNEEDAVAWFYLAGERKHPKALYALACYFAFGSFEKPELAKIRTLLAESKNRYQENIWNEFLNMKNSESENYHYRKYSKKMPTVWTITRKRYSVYGFSYDHNIDVEFCRPFVSGERGDYWKNVINGMRNIVYAVPFFARAAKNGSAEAQYIYAVCCAEGLEVDITPEYLKKFFSWYKEIIIRRDPYRAENWLREASRNNLYLAHYELAVRYLAGNDKSKNVEAVKLLELIQDSDIKDAKYLYATCLASGKGVKADLEKAEEIFEQLFVDDNKIGLKIGEFYLSIGNEERGIAWYQKSIDNGLADAAFALGVYYAGKNQHDKAKEYFENAGFSNQIYIVKAAGYYLKKAGKSELANAFLKQAAESGDKDVLFALASCYAGDRKRELEILENAASAGNNEAQYIVAKSILDQADRTESDLEKAIGLLKLSAESNFHPALTLLAKCYVDGVGVAIDLVQAVSCFERAIENGSGEACFYMAKCYVTGNWNKEKNIDTALDLLKKGTWRQDANSGRMFANYIMFGQFDDLDLYKIESRLIGKQKEYRKKFWNVLKEEFKHIRKLEKCDDSGDNCIDKVFSADELVKIEKLPENKRRMQKMKLLREKAVKIWKEVYLLEWIEHIETYNLVKPLNPATQLGGNFKCAWSIYAGAADNGDAYAQYVLGLGYFHGVYVDVPLLPKQLTLAVKYFRMSAEQGNFHAAYYLGYCYRRGLGVAKNADEALKWLIVAAEKGHLMAQLELGYFFKEKRDYQNAFKFFMLAAEQNSAVAQYEVAECYANGFGVQKNQAEMIKWYYRSADKLYNPALEKLKAFYSDAKNIVDKEAAYWYRNAENQEDKVVLYIYAICYLTGSLEEKNATEALVKFERAGTQGISDALFQAFEMHALGNGTPQDISRSLEWLSAAAKSGHPLATYYVIINETFDLKGDFKAFNLDNVDLANLKDKLKQDKFSAHFRKILKLANEGFVPAQYIYGFYLMHCKSDDPNSPEREKERKEAAEWFYKAAQKGMDAAKLEVVWAFAKDLISKNDKSKDPAFIYKCVNFANSKNKKDNDAEKRKLINYAYAQCFISGYGCRMDTRKAVSYYQKANDYNLAYYRLGLCYFDGKGIKKDIPKALEFFEKSSLPEGFYRAGLICESRGRNFAKRGKKYRERSQDNFRKAFDHFKNAANKGNAKAYYRLGMCYLSGQGVEASSELAAKNFNEAAERGDAEACYQLALCYLSGDGVIQSKEEAITLLKKAAEKGHPQAKEKLKNL